jgi:DNA invertase Pin-like site-specific DNA recombinase
MATETRRAAQYIRMSTDGQDLSPLIQKEGIAAFALSEGFQIVRTYEDDGKSGVLLSNRPRMRQLLSDVANGAPFTDVLVYDVTRWGRFQDVDAAAYYEYHCRMHGVQVIYTSESFGNDLTLGSVLHKSVKRLMAAQYSRDLAWKTRAGQQRVVSMGFHMGPLPALGYRRCSVSADGSHRKLLEHGERKLALTDRIEWVLGPEPEVALVRRICSAYAAGLRSEEIASLVRGEGWRTDKGKAVSTHTINLLLRNEALIGNFAWGVKSKGGKLITCNVSRRNGSVPRIIDDATWASIEIRHRSSTSQAPGHGSGVSPTEERAPTSRRPRQLRLALSGGPAPESYKRTFGSAKLLRSHTREFGRALCTALIEAGLASGFDPRTNVLTFWGARIRIRLMWPSDSTTWYLERSRSISEVQHVLVARMSALYCPADFFVLPFRCMQAAFSRELHDAVPRRLSSYWCKSAEELIGRLSKISASSPRPVKPTAARGQKV